MTRSRLESSAFQTVPHGTMRKDCRSIGPVRSSLRDPGHSRPGHATLIFSVSLFYHKPGQALEYCLLSSAILKLVSRTSGRSSFMFLKCPRSSFLSTDSCPQIGTSNSCPNFFSPSAAFDCLAPALPSASRAGAGRQSVPAPGHGPARRGPARDVTSRVTASRWPRRGGT